MPDGTAQTQPVWCSLDGNDVLVDTTRQRRQSRIHTYRITCDAIDR
jgi:hypothetical protein